jgi:hypothetical protein
VELLLCTEQVASLRGSEGCDSTALCVDMGDLVGVRGVIVLHCVWTWVT